MNAILATTDIGPMTITTFLYRVEGEAVTKSYVNGVYAHTIATCKRAAWKEQHRMSIKKALNAMAICGIRFA
jgi:hypothetical protein